MELSDLIGDLEELVRSGTGVPATGRILIDRAKLMELMNQIKMALPADIQEAQDLLQMRENLINQSLQEARRIRSTSEEDARGRVSDSEITKNAKLHAEEIIEEAQRRAQRILDEADNQADARRAGADQYAQATLQKLEEELSALLATVQHGIEMIDVQRESSS